MTLLPTPRASDGEHGGPNQRGSRGDLTVASAVNLLPTPTARDGKDSEIGPAKHRPDGVDTLSRALAHLLPTPRATDGTKGGPNQRGSSGDLMLPSKVTHLLPTPKAGDADFGLPRTSGRPLEKSTHLATRLHYTDFGDYTPAVARWERILGRSAPSPTQPSKNGKPQLSPAFVEWMMGLPAGWVTDAGLPRTQQLRALGNGVVPQQAAAAIRFMVNRAHTLEAA